MTTVIVENEACGFRTQITVTRSGRDGVNIVMDSDCEAVGRWGEAIGKTDWRDCLGGRPLASRLWQTAMEHLPHRSCPVLCGTLRAVETTVGLALPAGVRIYFVSDGG